MFMIIAEASERKLLSETVLHFCALKHPAIQASIPSRCFPVVLHIYYGLDPLDLARQRISACSCKYGVAREGLATLRTEIRFSLTPCDNDSFNFSWIKTFVFIVGGVAFMPAEIY